MNNVSNSSTALSTPNKIEIIKKENQGKVE